MSTVLILIISILFYDTGYCTCSSYVKSRATVELGGKDRKEGRRKEGRGKLSAAKRRPLVLLAYVGCRRGKGAEMNCV